jgi:hypothetical protein
VRSEGVMVKNLFFLVRPDSEVLQIKKILFFVRSEVLIDTYISYFLCAPRFS